MYKVVVEEYDNNLKPVYYTKFETPNLNVAVDRFVTLCLSYKSSELKTSFMDYNEADITLMCDYDYIDHRHFVNERYC